MTVIKENTFEQGRDDGEQQLSLLLTGSLG